MTVSLLYSLTMVYIHARQQQVEISQLAPKQKSILGTLFISSACANFEKILFLTHVPSVLVCHVATY